MAEDSVVLRLYWAGFAASSTQKPANAIARGKVTNILEIIEPNGAELSESEGG
ncbi:hypothetical protein [Leptothoe sp. PORK10 BA2]|uniref:hypothetical protein n=1 Tax=Leptothoe sp. PORK10 BA2 TaxID=3110254 RepID=UPI002B20DE7F|nr:hypothetical protein [Leptothoe sp. PORK10 BA2]MEA5465467.1 hypothetical protein [Leptothoe sp. PORK10 BA2]